MITNGQIASGDNIHADNRAEAPDVWALTYKNAYDNNFVGKEKVYDVGVVVALAPCMMNDLLPRRR
jgi:hypothetical protein